MTNKINRRKFLINSSAAGLTASLTQPLQAQIPQINKSNVKPVVIASDNGYTMKNGGTTNCVETAFNKIIRGDDVLDALIEGVNIVELDPLDASVGYGGRPNADGIVQLDSCCMHGPKKQAGGVAALEGIKTPSLVAKAVMQHTDHHLLVGKGAQEFARNMGYTIEADLNTENSREMWLDWKRRIDPEHYLDPVKREIAGRNAAIEMISEGLIPKKEYYGTINCNGINSKGDLCGVTTTSGLAWKIPSRVGDSPILGAGLYVDGNHGAAGSTGRGEANLFNLCSYLIVEEMRNGAHPIDAGMTALKRIKENTIEKRLLNARGLPNFDVIFYIIDKLGRYTGVSLYAESDRDTSFQYAVCTENGSELKDVEALLSGQSS
ncbi:MAG: N(4)-(beta-N-acetylglucosaminyl)-L-asparaginase [Woeseiaceae bacterium]|jgi:N4-(beta-N-acetylglucosaminyl)-L-asparaginase|nr:N(4)-(beta-N-acetylglucosaminyl)-L-asparaginase [Woeseiaceae bacterium]MDG1712605.1 N(4)-(beta-N-acetylglucosaminyl)-L-asparaginase [Woeseiaceae bacterium]